MYSGSFSAGSRFFVISMCLLFVTQFSVVFAAQAASGGTDFEIPISELNAVKKKNPAKRTTGEGKKKKKNEKSEKKQHESASTEPVDHPDKTPAGSNGTAQSEEPHQKLSKTEDMQIHHTPYSFVTAGKRTAIHTVINSTSDIRTVTCSVIPAEGGAPTLIKMEKVNGTRFTYMATLPAPPPGSPTLRYSIVTVDTLGKETRSQEYVTPVIASPVMPSWQFENDVPITPEKADEIKPK